MKVRTINQYHVREFIKKNFCIDFFVIELFDNDSLKIIDDEGSEAIFRWDSEEKKVRLLKMKLTSHENIKERDFNLLSDHMKRLVDQNAIVWVALTKNERESLQDREGEFWTNHNSKEFEFNGRCFWCDSKISSTYFKE